MNSDWRESGCEHEWEFPSAGGAVCKRCAFLVRDAIHKETVEAARRAQWEQGIERRIAALEEQARRAWPW